MGEQRENDIIPHQDLVEQVVDERISKRSLTEIVVPISYDEPLLLTTGLPIYTPSIGERLLTESAWSVSTEFVPIAEGATPQLALCWEDDLNSTISMFEPITVDDIEQVNGLALLQAPIGDLAGLAPFSTATAPVYFRRDVGLVVIMNDETAGDGTMSQGAAEIRLLVMQKAKT